MTDLHTTIEPPEPECAHDWQRSHEVVGKFPGVYGGGRGGAVLEVCSRCGAVAVAVHAVRPDTGNNTNN